MTTTFTTNQVGAPSDYVKYLWGTITKTDKLNDPDVLEFALAPIDGSFKKLVRGTYIVLTTQLYGTWFTGYITNDPELEYLGTLGGVPAWGYKYKAVGDEYILNLQPLRVQQSFYNTTMGKILSTLINQLAPGLFNTSGIEDGLVIAEYDIENETRFSDILAEFGNTSYFVFRCQNHVATWVPQDDVPATIVIDGHDKHFTPSHLKIKQADENIINDATIMGDIEPQAYVSEYFVGDGATGKIPLVSSVYGLVQSFLIDDDFSGSQIDSTQWFSNGDFFDTWVQLSNGFLNVLGGNGTFDVSLNSVDLLPLEGTFRLTHGDFDFVSSSQGVLGGLWTAIPSSDFTKCLYGLRMNGLVINPMVNGTVDSTQAITVNLAHRYVLRTVVTFSLANRVDQQYGFVDNTGAVGNYGGTTYDDTVTYTTLIVEIDPNTGNIVQPVPNVNYTTWINAGIAMDHSINYATYSPFVSSDLHCTLTGTTVSYPLQGSMEIMDRVYYNPPATPIWGKDTPSFNISQIADGTGSTLLVTTGTTAHGYSAGTDVVLAFGLTNSHSIYNGNYTISSVPSTTTFKVPITVAPPSSPITISLGTAQQLVANTWSPKLVGPNEIDVGDGLAPVATITDSAGGRQTSQQGLRNVMYNPGQATLEFFKNTVTETSEIPAVGEILHLRYRHAGVSMGRVISSASIAAEAAAWGDSGHRSALRKDLSPLPRTSVDCENAGAALVSDYGYLHYEGSYTQVAGYTTKSGFVPLFTGEPKSGTILTFINLPTTFLSVSQEILRQVKTTIDHIDYTSAGQNEMMTHILDFGHVDRINKTLRKFAIPRGAFVPQDSAIEPQEIDVTQVGTTFTVDVPNVKLASWDVNNLTFDTQQVCPLGGGFEIRYTDDWWGSTTGKNLITRITGATTQFQVPRSTRGKLSCVRAFTADNAQYSRFSALNHVAFPLQPQPPSATFDQSNPAQVYLDITLPNVLEDVWGIEIRDNDQTTVLYHADLSDPSVTLAWPLKSGLQVSPPNLYVYTYNLLGEYSIPFNASGAGTIPQLEAGSLRVDESNKQLVWVGSPFASGYLVEIDDQTNSFEHIVMSALTPNQSWPIPDSQFFPHRFFRVTPYNSVGGGTALSVEHTYVPAPLNDFTVNNEIFDVGASGPNGPAIPEAVLLHGYGAAYLYLALLLERTHSPN